MKIPITLLLSVLIFSAHGQERLSDFPFKLIPNINSIEKIDTVNGRAILDIRKADGGGNTQTWSTDGTTTGTIHLKSDQNITGLSARNARKFGNYISWLYEGVSITNGTNIKRISEYHPKDLEIITSRNNGFLLRDYSYPQSQNKSYEIHLIDELKNELVFLEDSVRAYATTTKYLYYVESENLDSFHIWEVVDGQKSLQNSFQFKKAPKKIDVVQVKDQIHLLISFDSSKTLLSKSTTHGSFEVLNNYSELIGNPLQTFIKDENNLPYFFINEQGGLLSLKLEEGKWRIFTKNKVDSTLNYFHDSFDKQIAYDKLFGLVQGNYFSGYKAPIIIELDIITGTISKSRVIHENHLHTHVGQIDNIEALGEGQYKIDSPFRLQAVFDMTGQSYVDSLRFLSKTEVESCFQLDRKKLCIDENLFRINETDSVALLPNRAIAERQSSVQIHKVEDGLIFGFYSWSSTKYSIWKSDEQYTNFEFLDSIPSLDFNRNRSWLRYIQMGRTTYFLVPDLNRQRIYKLDNNERKIVEVPDFQLRKIKTQNPSNDLYALTTKAEETLIEGFNQTFAGLKTSSIDRILDLNGVLFFTEKRTGRYGREMFTLFKWENQNKVLVDENVENVNVVKNTITYIKYLDDLTYTPSFHQIDPNDEELLTIEHAPNRFINNDENFAYVRISGTSEIIAIYDLVTQKLVKKPKNKATLKVDKLEGWTLISTISLIYCIKDSGGVTNELIVEGELLDMHKEPNEQGFTYFKRSNLYYYSLIDQKEFLIKESENLNQNSVKHGTLFATIHEGAKTWIWNFTSKTLFDLPRRFISAEPLGSHIVCFDGETFRASYVTDSTLQGNFELSTNYTAMPDGIRDFKDFSLRRIRGDKRVIYSSPYPDETTGDLDYYFEENDQVYAVLASFIDGVQLWKLSTIQGVELPDKIKLVKAKDNSVVPPSMPLSNENTTEAAPFLFPNPSDYKIYFRNEVETIESIIDSKGQQTEFSSQNLSQGLDISKYQSGVYIVLVKLKNGTLSSRRLIKR